MNHKRVTTPVKATVLGMTMVSVAACGVLGGASEDGDINVGGLIPLSGAGSVYGPDIASALEVAVQEINKNPPMGRDFKLHIQDDQTDPDAATRAAQKLISVNRVSAIMGLWSSAVTLAVAPMAIQSGTLVATASGAGDITDLDDKDLVWRFYPPGKFTGVAIAQAVREQGWDSVVAMSRNDPSGLTIVESFRESFEADEGEVMDAIIYPPDQSSYTSEVREAIAEGADVIVNVGYTPELAAMLKDAANVPEKGTWLSVGWSVNQDLIAAVGDDTADGLYSVDAAPNVEGAAFEHLRNAFEAETGDPLLASDTFATYAYDSAISIALAMASCECTEGSPLTEAMATVTTTPGTEVNSYAEGIAELEKGGDINYQGASSDLEFDDKGDQLSSYGVYQVTDGEIELVKPFTLPGTD